MNRNKFLQRIFLFAFLCLSVGAFAQNGECPLQIAYQSVYGTAFGDPADPSDDFASVDILVVGGNQACSWYANDPNNSTGSIGDTITIGPFPTTLGEVNFSIFSDLYPDCELPVSLNLSTIDPPNCAIGVLATTVSCVDSDSYAVEVLLDRSFDPSAHTWIVSGSDGYTTTGSYNVSSTLGPFSIADGGLVLDFADATQPSCITSLPIVAPNCSPMPHLQIEQKAAIPETQACLEVTAFGLIDVQELQFSLSWEPTVGTYTVAFNPAYFPQGWSLNESEATDGRLGFSVNDAPFSSTTIPDGTALLSLCFDYTGGCTEVVPTGSPVDNLVSIGGVYPDLNIEIGGIGPVFPTPSLTEVVGCAASDVTVSSGLPPDPNLEYLWIYNGIAICTCTDPTIIATDPGQLDLLMMDLSSGCSQTFSFPVILQPIPTIDSILVTNVNCNATELGSATIYLPENANIEILTPTTPLPDGGFRLNDLTAGEYEIQLRNEQNCISSVEFQVETDELSIQLQEIIPESCEGTIDGAILIEVLGGSGDYTYAWSNNDTTPSPSGLSAGSNSYGVTVTDNLLTCVATLENLNVPQGLIRAITQDQTICQNECFQLEVDAPNATGFEWNSLVQLSCDTCATPYIQETVESDYYQVTVKGPEGCEQEAGVFIDVRSYLDFGLLLFSNSPVCSGGELELYANVPSGISYQWSGPNGFTSSEENPIIPNATADNNGTYTIDIIDGLGCEVSAMADVEVLAPIEVVIEVQQVDCQYFCNGRAAFSITGGLPPYTITLADGQVGTGPFSNLCEGDYFAWIEDANGCMVEELFTVEADIDPTTDPPPTCSAVFFQYMSVGDTLTWCGNELSTTYWAPTQILEAPYNGLVDAQFDLASTCLTVEALSQGIDTLLFETCSTTNPMDCRTTLMIFQILDLEVWPGDTNDDGVANHFDLLPIGIGIDSTGPVRPFASTLWVPQAASAWPQQLPMSNTNYAHIDTDGNGVIASDDTLAIQQNWGETHSLTGESDPTEFSSNSVVEATPFYVKPDTLVEGATISIPIILGTDVNQAEEVYGIAFTVNYDPAIISPGSAAIDFSSSWLGAIDANMIAIQRDFHGQGQLRAAVTKIDGQNQTGFGTFGHFIVTIEDDILRRSTDLIAEFNISEVRLINFSEEEQEVDTRPTQAEVISTTTQLERNQKVSVFPNPANEWLTISSEHLQLQHLRITDALGHLILEQTLSSNTIELPTTNWSAGVYFIQLHTNQGMAYKRALVTRP